MKKGFTLIELIMIIVILGILASVAIPKYFDLQSDAQTAAEKGVVGGVRSGLATYYANACNSGTCDNPATLDAAAAGVCTAANSCFDNVLSSPITSDWTKGAGNTYVGPASTTYTYTDNGTDLGTFQ